MNTLFRLDKMAYFACPREHKDRFDKLNAPIIDLKRCCHELLGGSDYCTETCNVAAKYGHLDCLQHARRMGRQWDERTMIYASYEGHLECLAWAHENGCPWNRNVTSCASYSGRLECLKYAHENGCPWDESVTYNAASAGHLKCLKYAHENGCPRNHNAIIYAAGNDHINIMKNEHENRSRRTEFINYRVTETGYIACMRFAKENGFGWTWSFSDVEDDDLTNCSWRIPAITGAHTFHRASSVDLILYRLGTQVRWLKNDFKVNINLGYVM